MIIILIYIILRCFVPKYYFEGDEIRHLTTAKRFYKMWNKSFYDMHPPLYSWFIRLFSFAGSRAGVLVSFLSSIGLYVVCNLLYDALGLNLSQKTIALTCLAFNYTLIYYSNRTFRYQLVALLGTGFIYLLVIKNYYAAGFCWGLLGLTCTYAGLRGFWIWLLLGAPYITLLFFLDVFSIWFLDKAWIYKTHKYYPSGVEGKIERVNPFGFKQLLSPYYFKWSYAVEKDRQFTYRFPDLSGVFGLYRQFRVFTPIALFFCVLGAFLSPWWLNLLIGILLYPSLLKRFNPRNSIIAIPLLAVLLAKGISVFLK